jgi:hypothetical protein
MTLERGWRTVAFVHHRHVHASVAGEEPSLGEMRSKQFGIKNRRIPGTGHAPAYIYLGREWEVRL